MPKTYNLNTIRLVLPAILTAALTCILAATLTACGGGGSADGDELDTLFHRAIDSIEHNNKDFAREAIRKGHEAAADSDQYYLFTMLKAKYEFATTQKDSFQYTSQQIRDYLDRHPQRNRWRTELETEWWKQTGTWLQRATGRFDSAVVCQTRAIELSRQLKGHKETELRALANLADAYKLQGQYDKSAQCYKHALALADSIGQHDKIGAEQILAVAAAYTAMDDFAQSRLWWERARKLLPEMPIAVRFLYYNNRGIDYYKQQRYEECRRSLEQLDSLLDNQPDYSWERMYGRTNLADACLKCGDLSRARQLLDEVEPFFRKHRADIPLFYICTQRIELSLLEGHTAEALRRAESAPVPDEMIPDQKVMRLSALEKLYERTGNWADYMRVTNARRALTDSLANNSLRMQFSEKMLQYQRDAKVTEQQRTIEQHETTLRWLGGMLAATLLVIALIFVILRQKRRQQQLHEKNMMQQMMLTRMESTRNRITPHFIYNALSHEMLARMDGRQTSIEMLVGLLRRGGQMADEFCTTLDKELTFIDYYMAVESQGLENFHYATTIDEGIDPTQVQLPSMTVQILVENAIKHGVKLRDSKAEKRISIHVGRHGRGVRIEVSDNGPGFTKTYTGTGTRVISQTITLLNERNTEKMDYGIENTGSGCRAWLYLPTDFDYQFKQKTTSDTRHETTC